MKRFLSKRWHRIPVGIVAVLMALVLVAGSAFAAYDFLGFRTEVFVDEPLTVEYNLQGQYGGDANWHLLPDQDSLTIDGSAGDTFSIDLRINNRAGGPLTVNTVISGDTTYFTFSGFPNGSIPASDGDDNIPEWSGTVTIAINGDAPAPATYTIGFVFQRS